MRGGVWPSREGFFFSQRPVMSKRRTERYPASPLPSFIHTILLACVQVSALAFTTPGSVWEAWNSRINEIPKEPDLNMQTKSPKIKSKVKLCLVIYISHNQIKEQLGFMWPGQYTSWRNFPSMWCVVLVSDLITNALSAFTQRLDLQFKDC